MVVRGIDLEVKLIWVRYLRYTTMCTFSKATQLYSCSCIRSSAMSAIVLCPSAIFTMSEIFSRPWQGGGTDANVSITLFGTLNDSTGKRPLRKSKVPFTVTICNYSIYSNEFFSGSNLIEASCKTLSPRCNLGVERCLKYISCVFSLCSVSFSRVSHPYCSAQHCRFGM